MGKANANKVLSTFRKNYEDRKKSMMKAYSLGGINEEICTGWNGTRSCEKVYKSSGKSTTYNPLDGGGDGLNIGGKGNVKKAVEEVGDTLENMSKPAKYGTAAGVALGTWLAMQFAKAKRRRNG